MECSPGGEPGWEGAGDDEKREIVDWNGADGDSGAGWERKRSGNG